MSDRYLIYTSDRCSYCVKAKKLLRSENISFEERSLNVDTNKQYLVDNGYKTVPQIWNHRGEHIGGYSELRQFFIRTIWEGKEKDL